MKPTSPFYGGFQKRFLILGNPQMRRLGGVFGYRASMGQTTHLEIPKP